MLFIFNITIILLCSYVLSKATDETIKIITKISKKIGWGYYGATGILIASATTLPELFVGISSALNKVPELALGNVVGANIINLSLVIGLTTVIGGQLKFISEERIKTSISPLIYTFLPLLLIFDKSISRTEGLILLAAYIFHMKSLISQNKTEQLGGKKLRLIKYKKILQMLWKLFLRVGIMILMSQVIVNSAKLLAYDLKLSPLLIGLVIVSLGTTLPELVFNIKVAKEKKALMNMGSIVGSCVHNSTLIVGITALIRPIRLDSLLQMSTSALQYFFITILVFFFVSTKKRLDRWEGIALILIFSYYTGISLFLR